MVDVGDNEQVLLLVAAVRNRKCSAWLNKLLFLPLKLCCLKISYDATIQHVKLQTFENAQWRKVKANGASVTLHALRQAKLCLAEQTHLFSLQTMLSENLLRCNHSTLCQARTIQTEYHLKYQSKIKNIFFLNSCELQILRQYRELLFLSTYQKLFGGKKLSCQHFRHSLSVFMSELSISHLIRIRFAFAKEKWKVLANQRCKKRLAWLARQC